MFLDIFNSMANHYDPTNNCYSSSSPAEPDEISLFLQQVLLRSSSSSSSSFMRQQSFATPSDRVVAENQEPLMVPGQGRIYVTEPSPGLNSFTASAVANVSASSAGTLDNEPDEYDYESEEGVEALAEEAAPKPTPPRNSSKRSRAAEVHNLSEKRRRSRINEKMKALQNLIPNSNKTDKASMLDEAIEYLKQLQLQVQMLTMRNGLSLYPICLPGMLQPNQVSQMRMDICVRNKSSNANMAKAISMDQDTSADTLVSLQDNCVKQAPVADFSTLISSNTSFEIESSIQDHFGPFQLSRSSKGICREKVLPCQPLNLDCSQTSFTGKGYCLDVKATSSIPSETQPSNLKEDTLEACLAEGDRLLPNLVNNPIFSSQFNI